MDLADLTAYAGQRYGIVESAGPAGEREVTVLSYPETGRELAVLIKYWDSHFGALAQVCDIRCGQLPLSVLKRPYLSKPYRMSGSGWVGVRFGKMTEPKAVFRLFDMAVDDARKFAAIEKRLRVSGHAQSAERTAGGGRKESLPQEAEGEYSRKDAPLIMKGSEFFARKEALENEKRQRAERGRAEKDNKDGSGRQNVYKDSRIPPREERDPRESNTEPGSWELLTGEASDGSAGSISSFDSDFLLTGNNTKGFSPAARQHFGREQSGLRIPEKIRQLLEMEDIWGGTFSQQCESFYLQAKFMENYEDDFDDGRRLQYANSLFCPSYLRMTVYELRRYFTWRTHARRGEFLPASAPIGRLYGTELLNGIGAESPEDALIRLSVLRDRFVSESKVAVNGVFAGGINEWMLCFAVLHNIPKETARALISSFDTEQDDALTVLLYPDGCGDQEIFDALYYLCGKEPAGSVLMKKGGADGVRLMAGIWRRARTGHTKTGKKIVDFCFGRRGERKAADIGRLPVSKATLPEPVDYEINSVRKYIFRDFAWYESCYNLDGMRLERIKGFVHEAERELRIYLNIRNPLKEFADEIWVKPFAEAVIEDDRRAKAEAERLAAEAARPKVRIDFSELDKIRKDAEETRERLMTEEEAEGSVPESGWTCRRPILEEEEADQLPVGRYEPHTGAGRLSEKDDIAAREAGKTAANTDTIELSSGVVLDAFYAEVLRALLRGESVRTMILSRHRMPTIVADEINEAFFDEIGDNVVECDGEELSLVEDYREELDL